MSEPYVGLPTEGEGCAFSAVLDSPSCGLPPTVHIHSRATAWGDVGLVACDAHADIARTAGQLIAEHPYGPDCPESTICWLGAP